MSAVSLSSPLSLLPQLQSIVGKRFVLSRPEELRTYECDGCLLVKAPPEVVVLPASTDEVSAVVRLCVAHGIAYTARGGGTGLSGGALPLAGGVLIGLNRMNRILQILPEERMALVEVGVVNGWLNTALKPVNLFFAPDPSSQAACTLGGNIAENAGGIHCLKYGVTVDHILKLEVVLPDGQVVWLGGFNRRQAGPNLLGLWVGSEGTLGIATQAWVKVLPMPTQTRTYLAAFGQVAMATDAVSQIIAQGLAPAALEFMDAFTVKAVNQAFGVGFPEDSRAVLLIELDTLEPLGQPETLENALQTKEEALKAILNAHNCRQLRVAHTASERQQLWAARKGAVAAYGRILPAFYLHDCVIPRSELTGVLSQIEAIAEQYQIVVGNVFHAGDGNLHPNILFDPDDADMVQRVLQAGEAILEVCLSVGGVLSGEHGIGLEKSAYMPRLFTPIELEAMRQIKGAVDPLNLSNPGKILPQRTGCGEWKSGVPAEETARGMQQRDGHATLQGSLQRNLQKGDLWI